MTASLASASAQAPSRTVAGAHARRTPLAIRRTVATLGGMVAVAGIEHGVGEMLQGSVAPAGIAILSWPDSNAFRLLGGEPAMTIVPNLFITGVLAIVASVVFFGWATLFIHRRHGGLVLIALSGVLLLVGGGFAPPFIGLVLGLAATRIGASVRWWGTPPAGRLAQALSKAWPWVLALDVASLVALFPGIVVVAGALGSRAVPEAVAYVLMLAAFVFLPLSLVAALAADARTGA